MKTFLKHLISKIGNGVLIGIGIILSVGIFTIVYAWTTLDPVNFAGGKTLTSTLMQGIVNNINELNDRFGTQTEGKMCTSIGGKVTCSSDIPVAGVSTWIQNGTDIYYNGGNVGIGITTPATGVKLDVQGGKIKLKGITMDHITGTNPTCPVGKNLMRKWIGKTCTNVYGNCTTTIGWTNLESTPTCIYPTPAVTTCTADSWTEVICIGN